jgi:hypothetical protein
MRTAHWWNNSDWEKTAVLWDALFPAPLHLPQVQLGLVWDRTRSSAMTIRGLRPVGPLSIHWSLDELTWSADGVGINRFEPKHSEKNLMTVACTAFVGVSRLSSGCRDFVLKWTATAFSSILRGWLIAFVVRCYLKRNNSFSRSASFNSTYDPSCDTRGYGYRLVHRHVLGIGDRRQYISSMWATELWCVRPKA